MYRRVLAAGLFLFGTVAVIMIDDQQFTHIQLWFTGFLYLILSLWVWHIILEEWS